MTSEPLKLISDGMEALGLNYAFERWEDEPKYPYFTGEYQETPAESEDGMQECDFIMTGWHRGEIAALEEAKEKIENYFYRDGRTAIAPNGNAVVVLYSNSFVVPSGDAELKKIEIYLNVKEWKVT